MTRRFLATVDRRGRVTLPAELRDALGLRPGVKLDYAIKDGAVRVTVERTTVTTPAPSEKPG